MESDEIEQIETLMFDDPKCDFEHGWNRAIEKTLLMFDVEPEEETQQQETGENFDDDDFEEIDQDVEVEKTLIKRPKVKVK